MSMAMENVRENLRSLHEDLGALLASEDLTEEKLQRASETLLPKLYDALIPILAAAGEDVREQVWDAVEDAI